MSMLSNAGATLRRFTSMVFQRSSYRIFSLLGTKIDYADEVGDGTGSSTVAAVLNWVARTFPEAPPALWQELDNGQEEPVRQHPMLKLLRKPNAYYSGLVLWMATVIDWMVDGNAYWLKVRDAGGRVVELWWVPHWMICPKGDESEFIAYYEYTPDTERLRVEPEDIVHFRFGLDSNDPKLGMSQLKSVLREVFTDDEAANFTASLLRNMGVPGLVVSPEKGTTLNENDGLEMKKYVKEKFGGDKRGEALVMTGATQIAQFGFSPEQLLLRELRRIPEERVSAVTGIPAIVVGFGAGLERSTFTNMGEARAAAYEAGLIPMQRIMAEDVHFQLLPDFEDDVFKFRFGFDLKKVRVLQEDLFKQAQRWDLMIRGGWAEVAEGRRGMDLDVDDQRDHIFLRPLNIEAVPGAEGVRIPQTLGAQAALRASERMLELEASVETSKELVVSQFADLRAMVAEMGPQQPASVTIEAGAFVAHPAQVTVEPAQVTVEPAHVSVEAAPAPDLHVDLHMPGVLRPRAATVSKNGDGSIAVTYQDDETEQE